MKTRDFYEFIDKIAPFNLAASSDNVGIIVGDPDAVITGIAVALDITEEIADEAVRKNANLIITHHPVIYNPIKRLYADNIAAKLIKNNINAICAHTNFDIVEGGLSDIMLHLLNIKKSSKVLEPVHKNGMGYGRIVDLDFEISPKDLAEVAKTAFGCEYVRFVEGKKPVKKVAVCSGSAANSMYNAIEKGCDAYICGDIKHENFIDAKNMGLTLIDAGHFHTEDPFCRSMAAAVTRAFPNVPCFIADENVDPVKYI